MESSLHCQLKERYGPALGGRSEVRVEGFRIDAVAPDGELVEIQSGSLGPLRPKLARLLPGHSVRVVKPIVVARRLVRRARPDGADLSARRSPRRGEAVDVFDDLVGLASLFPHPNLRIEILEVEIDEIRVARPGRRGILVVDRRLRAVLGSSILEEPGDLWELLPDDLDDPFTTRELADQLGRSDDFARRVAYCLRLSGAAQVRGKVGNRPIYARAGRPSGRPASVQTFA